jgi:hypothetical protein
MRALATIAGIALFASLLYWGLRGQARVECDVCLTFRGHTECVVGQGEDEAMAVHAARTGACALLGSGVTDAVACSSTPPSSMRCREL